MIQAADAHVGHDVVDDLAHVVQGERLLRAELPEARPRHHVGDRTVDLERDERAVCDHTAALQRTERIEQEVEQETEEAQDRHRAEP